MYLLYLYINIDVVNIPFSLAYFYARGSLTDAFDVRVSLYFICGQITVTVTEDCTRILLIVCTLDSPGVLRVSSLTLFLLQVVTPEDIRHFFEEQQSRKRRRANAGQYYCS